MLRRAGATPATGAITPRSLMPLTHLLNFSVTDWARVSEREFLSRFWPHATAADS